MTTILPVAGARRTFAYLVRSAVHPLRVSVPAVLLTLLAALATVAAPLLLGALVDTVRTGGRHSVIVAVGATIATLAAAALTAAAQRAIVVMGCHVAADLREQVIDNVLELRPDEVEKVGLGDVTARVSDDVDCFVDAVPVMSDVVIAVVTVLVSISAFGALDWRLAATFAVIGPVYATALWLYLPRSAKSYAAERRAAAARGHVLLETLDGIDTVVAYGMADTQTARVDAASREARDTAISAARLSLFLTKSMNAAEAVGLASIVVIGHYLVHADSVSLGQVAGAALLFHRLFGPLGTLLGSVEDVQRALAAATRLVGVVARTPRAGEVHRLPGPGGVRVDVADVRHSYDGDIDVVTGVDLAIPAATSVALVGASGAGKSTIAAIVAGRIPPRAGSVLLDDGHGVVGVAELDADVLPRWVGFLTQDVHTFSGTIRDDLLLARPGSDDDEIRAALSAVDAHWVAHLESGLDTVVGRNGVTLTPAQAQHLGLARLVLADPAVVVIDEATAEAGSAMSFDLDRAAIRLLSSRTSLVVAHRLSQAQVCTTIAVVDHGLISERGAHHDLLSRQGSRYATAWKAWRPEP